MVKFSTPSSVVPRVVKGGKKGLSRKHGDFRLSVKTRGEVERTIVVDRSLFTECYIEHGDCARRDGDSRYCFVCKHKETPDKPVVCCKRRDCFGLWGGASHHDTPECRGRVTPCMRHTCSLCDLPSTWLCSYCPTAYCECHSVGVRDEFYKIPVCDRSCVGLFTCGECVRLLGDKE